MKVKFLSIRGEDILSREVILHQTETGTSKMTLGEFLGEVKTFDPPEPEDPYWEIAFKEYSIFTSEPVTICIENPPLELVDGKSGDDKEGGRKRVKTVTQMKGV